MAEHKIRTCAAEIDNGRFGTVQVLVAVHERSEGGDAFIIRTYAPGEEEPWSEVWIQTAALPAVLFALDENRPRQLSLFDQDA